MRPGKIAMLIAGSLLALVAVGFLAGGGTLTWIHATQRDSAGFYSTGTRPFASSSYAITSEHIELLSGEPDWSPAAVIGTVRIRAERVDGGAVFVGLARQSDVERYLRGSAHDEITELSFDPFRPQYQHERGEVRPPPPADQSFWAAYAVGVDRQTLTWEAADGEWAVVVMNADGSRMVDVDASGGIKTGLLLPIGLALAGVGLVLGVIAIVLIVFAVRGQLTPAPAVGTPEASTGYPVRVTGQLEPGLHRALWLVKWILVIPHVLVLAFLWIAFCFLTVFAWFAILFTGRYPRGVFEFNVGVMRWTWRVTFYAFTFMTDRYPPFSLESDPTYPADVLVDYPARLSRGLVLVKSWLLALPHLVIVGLMTGGFGSGGALAFVLALIAAVLLAFTSTYPVGLFDLIIGMERWHYRVLAYVGLMTDEYPPFRLDMGGSDPGTPPPPAPTPPDRSDELVTI